MNKHKYATVIMSSQPVHTVAGWTDDGSVVTNCRMLLDKNQGGIISSPDGTIVRNHQEVASCGACQNPDPTFIKKINSMMRCEECLSLFSEPAAQGCDEPCPSCGRVMFCTAPGKPHQPQEL